jgi:hypothetical protein
MPIAYLDAPQGIGIDEKRKLVKAMYDALHEAYPFPDDVRIFLREWPSVSVGQDGRLESEPARPVFMMHVPKGVNIEAKRKMLKRIGHLVPGFVDGRPAAFVRDPNDVAGRTTYIVLLEWAEDRVLGIRDFRFARYITDGAALLVAD